jgi:glyoxylate/hydroxypyruvate reductase
MAQQQLTVLVYLRESIDRYRQRLQDDADVRYVFCATVEDVQRAAASADAVLGSITFPVEHLLEARNLRWVQVAAAGVDRFLLQGDLPEGVLLTRADVGFGDQISEYVIAHLLARTQRLREVFRQQDERRWQPLVSGFLKGQTIGIAGTGSIGRAVAQRACALGMRAVGWSRSARGMPEFERVYGLQEIAAFLSQLNVLVLCLPLTDETRGRFGSEELGWLPASAVLINVARGALIDEDALLHALRCGDLQAAILDVFEREPLPPDHPFWKMENVTVTSHQSGLNVPDEIIDFFLENLRRFQSGLPLRGLVDLSKGY